MSYPDFQGSGKVCFVPPPHPGFLGERSCCFVLHGCSRNFKGGVDGRAVPPIMGDDPKLGLHKSYNAIAVYGFSTVREKLLLKTHTDSYFNLKIIGLFSSNTFG